MGLNPMEVELASQRDAALQVGQELERQLQDSERERQRLSRQLAKLHRQSQRAKAARLTWGMAGLVIGALLAALAALADTAPHTGHIVLLIGALLAATAAVCLVF